MQETATALGLAQAYDRRTVGEMDVRAWHAILGDLSADDVLAAIRLHYTDQTEWIMPAHIRRRVDGWKAERQRAARSTGWAPGQAGVPKGQAMPEITGRIDESVLTRPVRELLASMGVHLREGSREALMPRTVAWEREHRAYLRVRDGEANPHYKPRVCRGAVCDAEPCVYRDADGGCSVA
jgi:hypothetical protein